MKSNEKEMKRKKRKKEKNIRKQRRYNIETKKHYRREKITFKQKAKQQHQENRDEMLMKEKKRDNKGPWQRCSNKD